MNSKQRVYQALAHRQPDRVPRFIWLGGETVKMFTEKLGITPFELDLKLGNDILQTWLSINGEMAKDVPEGTMYKDEWGITWKREGYYNNVVCHPMAGMDVESVKAYSMPDPLSVERYKKLDMLVQNYGERYFIGADISGSLFEPAYHLRGMQDLMIDMASEGEEAEVLLDRLMDFCIKVSVESVRRGADWIWLGDDLGSQKGMLMSPNMWRKYFKPRMKHIIETIRSEKPEMIIAYHSCGSIYPVIGDLVEIGINVLNPIQESAVGMDQMKIFHEYGDWLTLMCGVDTQQFLTEATTVQVKEKTRDLIVKLGRNGGFIFAASHSIQPDTPQENIAALFEALDES
jgi:uroporphyrinogen decarboxylase